MVLLPRLPELWQLSTRATLQMVDVTSSRLSSTCSLLTVHFLIFSNQHGRVLLSEGLLSKYIGLDVDNRVFGHIQTLLYPLLRRGLQRICLDLIFRLGTVYLDDVVVMHIFDILSSLCIQAVIVYILHSWLLI